MFKKIQEGRALVLFIMMGFVATGCGTKKHDPMLARFGRSEVRQSEFLQKMMLMPKEIRSVAFRHKRDFIEQMLDESILQEEAKRRKIDQLPDVKDLLSQAHRKVMIAKLVELEVDQKVKLEQDEVERYYEAHREDFMTPLMLRASQILVETEEEAKAIRAQIDQGADFEELARKKSLDYTGRRGGDIGFFQKGQLIPDFENVAFAMKKGEISPVFKTQFGYHILKLTDRAESAQRDFKSVRTLLEKQLLVEKRSKAYKEFVSKLKGNRKVELNESVVATL